jgi:ParB-like chromosome segregation protein Spo0J
MPPKSKTAKTPTPPPTPKTAPFFRLMSLELLQPNAYNARRFKENMTPQRQARFWELVASVREKGILEPLLVRLVPGDEVMFEVIAGERRYRAAKHVSEELALSAEAKRSGSLPPRPVDYMVPCMIHDLDDDAAFDLMLIENLQREDLSPAETAAAFKAYLDKHHNTPDAVAELSARTGIPPHAIRRQVRLLTLPETILAAWRDGSITQSHAELFTRLDDPTLALDLLAATLRSKLTVRELAERIGASATDLDKGFFDQADFWQIGDIVSRDGSDEQEILHINETRDLIEVKCVKVPSAPWCCLGEIEINLTSRYSYVRPGKRDAPWEPIDPEKEKEARRIEVDLGLRDK